MIPTSRPFQVVSPFKPMGDQPAAIESLVARLSHRSPEGQAHPHACLLGATGTGKTFTMAHTIARLGKPTLILSHNKTLAAQLYEEMKELFPKNAVSYFVSYYDYYQPEAYIPARDIYIEKDSSRNDDLDKLRLAATSNILSRRDTIVVSSVSCIFGLGSPLAYGSKVLTLEVGRTIDRRSTLLQLNAMQYARAEIDFSRGHYRVRGDMIEIWPAYEAYAVRVELGGDTGSEVTSMRLVNPTSGEEIAEESRFFLFPARHYVTDENSMAQVVANIRAELNARIDQLRGEGKLLEAQRLLARTKYDLEMLEETGICNGVENYSRHLDGRQPGERPWTLLDYFDQAPPASGSPSLREGAGGRAALTVPSHEGRAIRGPRPQFAGPCPRLRRPPPAPPALAPRSPPTSATGSSSSTSPTSPSRRSTPCTTATRPRKKVLVEHGFRLPSALDNRPLRFEEFLQIVPQMLFVSATPGPFELEKVGGEVAEQVIPPAFSIPPSRSSPRAGQVPDLIERCMERCKRNPPERVIVTALTKRLCEDLTLYLHEKGLRVRYLHSEIDTLERIEILTDLRRGEFDVLVGVNLLREGLDLPEVSLVGILDADKEGFLRSATSLIQQIGRAARNVNAHVVMYADTVTPSMQAAIDETDRRRAKQAAYNAAHGITPQTIIKAIRRGMETELRAQRTAREAIKSKEPEFEVAEMTRMLEDEMLEAAAQLEFEKAAKLRDQVKLLQSGKHPASVRASQAGGKVRRSDMERNGTVSSIDRKAGMPGVRANRRGKGRK